MEECVHLNDNEGTSKNHRISLTSSIVRVSYKHLLLGKFVGIMDVSIIFITYAAKLKDFVDFTLRFFVICGGMMAGGSKRK